MATIIATGRIIRPDLLTPALVDLENAALAELGRVGAVDAAYLHEGRTEVTLVIDADDTTAAAAVLEKLPFVAGKQMVMRYTTAQRLLTPEWTRR
ncbi:hypothetical protein ACEXQE_04900 [Herbiconiux sp. P17]|uniref:hypothetical protein n=1 Tax=Herbiconiux wuyangfengii TaxID=3342794 RepID=UPI0035BAA991